MELEPELVFRLAMALLELEQAHLRPKLALLRPELAFLRLERALLRPELALKADFWSYITFSSKFCSFQPNGAGAARLQGIGQSQCWSLGRISAGAGAKNSIFAGSSHHYIRFFYTSGKYRVLVPCPQEYLLFSPLIMDIKKKQKYQLLYIKIFSNISGIRINHLNLDFFIIVYIKNGFLNITRAKSSF